MDFDLPDLPEIDDIVLPNEPDLEGNHQTSTIANGFTWPANISTPLLPPCQNQSPRLSNGHHQPLPQPMPEANEEELDDDTPIDNNAVNRVGALAYAEQCKEWARQRCKEMRKNEHMANGNHKFVSRQKKGDKSVNDRDRHNRRIAKNQDSAHAARYAKKVYVDVLKELVKKGEEENHELQLEIRRLREENSQLRRGNCTQTRGDSQLLEAKNNSNSQNVSHASGLVRYDSLQIAKLFDMLTSPEQVSAQAQDVDFAEGRMGIQPSPAV